VTDVSTTTDADPKSSATYRGLKAAVIILGALLVLAFALVVVGIGMRMTGHAPGQSSAPGKFELPSGAKITSVNVVQNRLIMAVQTTGGNRIYIFSTDDGHLIGQIQPAGQTD